MTTTGDIKRGMGERYGVPLPSVSAIYPASPDRLCRGLMIRNSAAKEFFAPNIESFVHEIKWDEWQPVDGPLLASKISETNAVLDWAEANDKRVRFRIFTGIYAPLWTAPEAGSMDWYEYSAANGEHYKGKVPIWWESGYRGVYNEFMSLLVDEFAAHPALCEVVDAACSTVYAEPCNRQWGSGNNVATAYANGYTVAADVAAIKQSFVDYQMWADEGVAVYTAFNPWQEPKFLETTQAGGVKPVPATTYELFEAFRNALGRCAVFANNSIGAPVTSRGPRFADMWNYMGAAAAREYPFPQPVGFQTMNTRVMKEFNTTAYDTADMCEADLGACSVEMPEGWLTDPLISMTTEQAADLNARLAENTAAVEEN